MRDLTIKKKNYGISVSFRPEHVRVKEYNKRRIVESEIPQVPINLLDSETFDAIFEKAREGRIK